MQQLDIVGRRRRRRRRRLSFAQRRILHAKLNLGPSQRAEEPRGGLDRREAVAMLAEQAPVVGKALDECEFGAEVQHRPRLGEDVRDHRDQLVGREPEPPVVGLVLGGGDAVVAPHVVLDRLQHIHQEGELSSRRVRGGEVRERLDRRCVRHVTTRVGIAAAQPKVRRQVDDALQVVWAQLG